MKVTISGKGITLTPALKDVVTTKVSKLERYFADEVQAHVTLSVQKSRHTIEVTIPFNGIIIRGEECTDDMYISIDNVVDKLERQIIKYKKKLERRVHGESLRFANIPEDTDQNVNKVVKTKKFPVKPMDLEEAVLQMDMLEHDFYVFKNAISNEVNVVYKRKDGNYGLIEPEL